MGFLPDIQQIMRKVPEDRQTLMFSATFPREIERMSATMLRDPERVTIGTVTKPVDTVHQLLYPVRPEDKNKLLVKLLKERNITSGLIFLRTKERTERVARMLRKKGFKAARIHGDLSQRQRQQALEGFRSGKYRLLVATDVAARGIDVEGISHVVNYDIPPTSEDYIHRVGRTARAQSEGDAITFVAPTDHTALETIERALGRNLPQEKWEDAPRILTMYHPPGSKRAAGRSSRISALRRKR